MNRRNLLASLAGLAAAVVAKVLPGKKVDPHYLIDCDHWEPYYTLEFQPVDNFTLSPAPEHLNRYINDLFRKMKEQGELRPPLKQLGEQSMKHIETG